MRPTPIPDDEIWEGSRRMVMAAPGGDLTDDRIRPLEVLVDDAGDGTPRFCARMVLEDGDLEKLQAGGTVWLAFYSCVIPFSADVKGPAE